MAQELEATQYLTFVLNEVSSTREPARSVRIAQTKKPVAAAKRVSGGGINLQLGHSGPDHLDDEFEKF